MLEDIVIVILCIGDLHAPFMHPQAVSFLAKLKRQFRPDRVIQIGDEVDAHALSEWGADPDGMSAGDEYKAAIAQLRPLYSLFPELTVCESNHGKRPFRRAFKAGIPKAYLKQYRDFMEAPAGWNWVESVEVDGVVYQHGEGYSGAQGALRAAERNRRSTCIGHIHSYAGVQFSATKWDQIFGFNVGWLGNYETYAMHYGRIYPAKPVLGAGIIYDGRHPIFIPMELPV